MISIDTSGLDKLQKKLEEVHGTHEVSTDDLMTDDFIRDQTNFSNWQELMDAGGVESNDDLKQAGFCDFIRSNTQFESFDDMLKASAQHYLLKKLDL